MTEFFPHKRNLHSSLSGVIDLPFSGISHLVLESRFFFQVLLKLPYVLKMIC